MDFWAREELFTARTFPFLIALGGGLLAILYVVFPPVFERPDLTGINGELMSLIILMVLYATFLESLGFLLATGIFLGAGLWLLGERQPFRLGLVTISLTGGFYLLMILMEIHLPQGSWIGAMGELL